MARTAGKLRPSQAVTQFGPGALIDLPEMSMVVAGIDEWHEPTAWSLFEPRLQRALGVKGFKMPPYLKYKEGVGGVPARVFPRYLVCPRCNRLAPHEDFAFEERSSRHLCKSGRCQGKGRAPAYPARFMVACPNGHLDDFPWHHWVHPDIPGCKAELRIEDSGKTGAITDLWVRCPTHDVAMSLGLSFGEQGRRRLPGCEGARPWLDDYDPKPCDQQLRVLLRGASNAYFAVTSSALSIPPFSDPLHLAVSRYEGEMARITTRADLETFLSLVNLPDLAVFEADQVWDALLRLRGELEGEIDPAELRRDEWDAFMATNAVQDYRSEFRTEPALVPEEAEGILSTVRRVVRLREVRALRGFTRIDPVPDIGDLVEVKAIEAGLAPISGKKMDWLPGVELRGEGIFLGLDPDRLAGWEAREAIASYEAHHRSAQRAWHDARSLPIDRPRGARFVLVHTLAHLLMRRFELECGYGGSALRERLYVDDSMAGILIYTATPDSQGTLGGLVELGKPSELGPMLARALDEARLCANDPLCATRRPGDLEAGLNGAACHACLLASETSCEMSNHHLDRAIIVPTIAEDHVAFVR